MDFSHLSHGDQQKMQSLLEEKQVKDFMRLYTSLVDRCFTDCIHDFTSSKLSEKEDSCLIKCADKFLKHSEKVGIKFQEQNNLLNQSLQK
jgi:import inner membrane translocase subunit TIM9